MKIFATRVWGFDPWNWPVVVFGREGDLNSLLIGHTVDPKQRLLEVNTHVPSEVLGERWQIVLTHPWNSSTDAFAMEQRVLKVLERFRTEGERVRCSRKEIDRAWQAGVFTDRGS